MTSPKTARRLLEGKDQATAAMRAPRTDYVRDPDAIYRDSFERVRAACDLTRFDDRLHPLLVRLVHACALPGILDDIVADPAVGDAARTALDAGRPILVDAEMVASGITRAFLPEGADIVCTLNHDQVPGLANGLKTTRSAAAVDLWGARLEGAIVAIGNAPTALFRVLEVIAQGGPRPAAIFGLPIGFVGAAESKDDLIAVAQDAGIPFLTLRGRFGGSALAAAAVNAAARPAHSGGSKP